MESATCLNHEIMRAFNIILGVIFTLCAVLQYNDTDPYIWIPIYGYAAVICFMASARKYNKWMILAGAVLYFIYMLTFIPGVESWFIEHERENIAQSMKATKPWIEETREFFGLLIMVAVFVFQYFSMRKWKSTHRN